MRSEAAPTSRASLDLRLPGLTIRLAADDGDWEEVLDPVYGPFLGSGPRFGPGPEETSRFHVELRATSGIPDRATIEKLVGAPPELTLSGGRLAVDGVGYAVEIDLGPRRGRIRGPLCRYPVDTLVRCLLPLAVDDALTFHGALVLDDGRAWVCAGPSGSGKTTLSKLLGERAVCDEQCLVRRTADGWRAHGLPYWRGRPATGRLEGVFLLDHGVEGHRVRRLRRSDAFRRLSAEVTWPAPLPGATEGAWELLAELIEAVPVRELAFLPEAGVWDVISGAGTDNAPEGRIA